MRSLISLLLLLINELSAQTDHVSYTRQSVPIQCAEYVDGVCYSSCAMGYTGSLGMCTSDAPMSIVYDSEDESFDASSDNKITDIPITDSMSFSMDITVNTLYTKPAGGWPSATVFECNNDELEGWVQLPRVGLLDSAGDLDGFSIIVGSSHDNQDGQVQTAPVEEGKTYHLQFIFTQSTLTILQDNVITFETDDFAAHDVSEKVECFVGDTQWTNRPSADVTVSNIVIETPAKFGFVSDKSCEYYGMERIEDPDLCKYAGSQLAGTNGISDDFDFYDRDTWTHPSRPSGCTYHRFGNVEQWSHGYELACDVWGFAGCLCTKPAIEKTEQWIEVRKYELLTDTTRTWDEAQAACQDTFGTDLASIHSTSDNDVAIELCTESGADCWIGLRRYSEDMTSWNWSDGSTVDYGSDFSGVIPWADNEPNNWGDVGEECAELRLAESFLWNDVPCGGQKQYALCNAVGSSYEVISEGTEITLVHSDEDGLEVNGKLLKRGCGKEGQSSFGLIIDDLEDQKWHKIRYTIEFVSGDSSCFSLFGNTHYGDFEDDADFGLTTLDVIENTLNVGEWNGEKILCNNEKSNFMHRINGVGNKGYLTVEQERDLSVESAGISSGFSCTHVGQIVRYKDISVAYWSELDLNSGLDLADNMGV